MSGGIIQWRKWKREVLVNKTTVDVTAAVICREGQIFVARRGPGRHMAGYWEFPGGKVEAGETREACLRRELAEELSIDVEIGRFIGESLYDYGEKTIRLLAYEVTWVGGEIRLKDHDQMAWYTRAELADIELAPADIPLLAYL
jgi:8-oxo-dGTP diphosphatase